MIKPRYLIIERVFPLEAVSKDITCWQGPQSNKVERPVTTISPEHVYCHLKACFGLFKSCVLTKVPRNAVLWNVIPCIKCGRVRARCWCVDVSKIKQSYVDNDVSVSDRYVFVHELCVLLERWPGLCLEIGPGPNSDTRVGRVRWVGRAGRAG